ncbi:MAG: translation initiation factor IF-3 [Bacillota bacterium]|nr:translation initiation factor IF-3 [Bacillota bacterium]REJ37051.1 MAG: translation initiation factor IF-3 [Bacillota bacterium]
MSRDLRVNGEIRVREVRVISPEGEQLGIMPIREALLLAQERNLDLVEVAPNAQPPVCRIMDYGKFRYEQSKRERDVRKKQKAITVKELRMTPKIDTHDFQIKLRNAERFLRDGDKVKIAVRFRGREIVHADLARDKLVDLANQLQGVALVERPPRLEGRQMIMILAPKQQQEAKVQAAPQGS